MGTRRSAAVMLGMEALFNSGCDSDRSDCELLERFIEERDDNAFEKLLVRHGAMVWSLSRRITGNAHLAEDVFQAVFLVLAGKAQYDPLQRVRCVVAL